MREGRGFKKWKERKQRGRRRRRLREGWGFKKGKKERK